MNPPTIGIVVVARNRADTLHRAMASVLDELGNLPTADVVVIDGASTDGTMQIAAGLPRVRAVPQQGLGLAAARNQGIAAVDGDLIAFLDADDRWADGSIATRLAALAIRPQAIGVVGHLVAELLPGQPIAERHRDRIGRPVPGFTPGALLAHRRAFELVGPFDEQLTVGSDSDWFLRARSSGHMVALVTDVVLHKGIRNDSLSNDVETYRRELLQAARRFVAARDARQ